MDTKLKSSDKYFTLKFICILIAVILACVSSFQIIGTIEFAVNHDALEETLQSLAGIKDNPFTLASYSGNMTVFLDCVCFKTLYPEASKENYEKYKELQKKEFSEDYQNNLKMIVLYESTRRVPYYTLSAAEKGYITLVPIDGLEEHSCYNKSTYVFSGYDENNRNYYNLDRFKNTDELLYNGIAYTDDIIDCYYDYDEEEFFDHVGFESIVGIDCVTRICNCEYKGTKLDGYYGVIFNDGVITSGDVEYFLKWDEESVATMAEFKNLVKQNEKRLSEYKNVYYAAFDGNDKLISSSFGKEYQTVEDVEDRFSDSNYYFSSKNNKTYAGTTFDRICTQNLSNRFDNENIGRIIIYFDEGLKNDDAFSESYALLNITNQVINRSFIVVMSCLAGILICIIILCSKAGRRNGGDELYMSYFDRIPVEIKTILNIGLAAGICALAVWYFMCILPEIGNTRNSSQLGIFVSSEIWDNSPLNIFVTIICSALMILLFIDWVLYIARHIKNRNLIRSFTIPAIASALSKTVKKNKSKREAKMLEKVQNDINRIYFKSDGDFVKKLIFKALVFVVIPNILVSFISGGIFIDDMEGLSTVLFLTLAAYDVILIRYIIRVTKDIKHILDVLHCLRNGEHDKYINPLDMPSFARIYADDLNRVNDGMRIAVEKAVKEQRTKTELITNVSHDLKTPLTSIINYVDLLTRCNIEDEEALNYIAVLGEKSDKLKKLIEDLIEASKASAGNVNVELVNMSLSELVTQNVGEYEDAFKKRNLTVIIDGDGDFPVIADSRLSYRILDNIMCNVGKYALSGTRVYVRLSSDGEKSSVTVINVSENQLNIPAEELLKRFVRGDESRSTEGSGLGLSIAENFAEIQGGSLKIEINGDLFTAKVEFVSAENK